MTTTTRDLTTDRELAAVLICLAPLGRRGLRYVDTQRREFDWREMHDSTPWSTGESWLIRVAGDLWTGSGGMVDLAYIATLDDRFFMAVMNAIAAYRGADFRTDWIAALDPESVQ